MNEGDFLVGRYQLVRKLGTGAMGQVWLAHDSLLHRHVAVKHLLPGSPRSLTDELVQRAMREGRLAAQLNHPNAVQIHDLVIDGGEPHVVMEYIDGETLEKRLERTGPVPAHVIRPIIRQVAAALGAAHQLGIVHRDVKPANILLAGDGVAKLADFGIARASNDPNLTNTGMVIGTLAYMAPEVGAGDPATPASDVWSLGATAYAAVEGRAPFSGEGSARMLYRKVSELPPLPTHAGELTDVMRSMMATEAADRPAAVEVARALEGTGQPHWSRPVPPLPAAAPDAPTVRTPPAGDTDPTRLRAAPTGRPEPTVLTPAMTTAAPAKRNRTGLIAALVVLVLALVGGAVAVVLASGGSGGPAASANHPSTGSNPPPTDVATTSSLPATPTTTPPPTTSPTAPPPVTATVTQVVPAAPVTSASASAGTGTIEYSGPGGLSASGPASWDNSCPGASDPYYWCAGAQGFLGGYFRLREKTRQTSSFDADVNSELSYFRGQSHGSVSESGVSGWSVSDNAVDLVYHFRNSQGIDREGIERVFTAGGSTYVIGTTDVPANFGRTQQVFDQLVSSASV